MIRIFNPNMDALGGAASKFSREFTQWLQSLIDWASIRQYEADLGSTPRLSGSFTLTDGAIREAHKIIITQAPGPYTNKGTRADEAEMDAVHATAKAADGSATVYWSSPTYVVGNFKFHYRLS